MRTWVVSVLLVVSGCVQNQLVPCGDLLCPTDQMCRNEECVSPEQLVACEDKDDGAACLQQEVPGFCTSGFCHVPICGNGTMEPGESCDDGNNVAGDGCAADCLSGENCGNDIVDAVTGEECDRGTPGLSGDGCTSTCKVEFDTWHDLTPRTLRARQLARMVYDNERGEFMLFGGFDGSQPLDETWIYKSGAWSQRFPAASPEARYGHSMVYDAFRKRVVMFGGTNGADMFGGTWEWDGTVWTKLNLATHPSDRQNAAMAYNSTEHLTYLFGGSSPTSTFPADTWTFDGTVWTKLTNPGPGSPVDAQMLRHPSMAFDPVNDVMLMVAETQITGSVANENSLYNWDPAFHQWYEQEQQHMPAFIDISMTWDPRRQRIVLFGGYLGDFVTTSGSTYEVDGFQLQVGPALPAGGPPTRARAAAAAGPNGLVLYGGIDSQGRALNDTWLRGDSLGTTIWASTPTNRAPVPRIGAVAAYDAARGEVVLYGGADNGALGDTWLWDQPNWSSGPAGPQARAFSGMAYNEVAGETVLFGGTDFSGVGSGSSGEPIVGCGSGTGSGSGSGSGSGAGSAVAAPPGDAMCPNEFSDTWEFKNGLWMQISLAASPTRRVLPAMTYDADHGRVILFGGTNGGVPMADTWTFKRSDDTWTALATTVSPPAMYYPRLAYDRTRNKAVLYGVIGQGIAARAELWELDGSTWSKPPVGTIVPPTRTGGALLYDPLRQRVLMFGGKLPSGQLINDTWEWNGATATWTQRFPVQSPPLRTNAAVAYDAIRGKVLVFGGLGPLGVRLDDIWAYGFEAPGVPVETCGVNDDADHDGLRGCFDPDCWATCTPTCPPGTSCP